MNKTTPIYIAGHRGLVGSALMRALESRGYTNLITRTRADFIYDNIAIATNVIRAAYEHGAGKLVNLGSSCIYPKHAPQPMKEGHLLTGPLEPTNEPYAVAKIAALVRKIHEAKHSGGPVPLWGDGSPLREFLHVDDLADALIAEVEGDDGEFHWDTTKPNGTPRKLMDSSLVRSLGWEPQISLRDGIRSTYEWFTYSERT